MTGTVQASGLACGFLFLSLYHGVLGSYESLLFGSFLGITSGQVLALLAVAAVAILLLALAGRPLLFASVDEGVAARARRAHAGARDRLPAAAGDGGCRDRPDHRRAARVRAARRAAGDRPAADGPHRARPGPERDPGRAGRRGWAWRSPTSTNTPSASTSPRWRS